MSETGKDRVLATASPRKPTLESVTTINQDGSRAFLHPADVRGKWTLARRISGLFLMGVYSVLPWITINGYPAVFLNLEQRRFHFFGLTLAAQDLWVVFFGISGLGFSLFFVASIAGRLWCGWACPYTVFLDHLFRRIERWTEGDATQRRRLDAAPWSMAKIAKRGTKHLLYLLSAALIAHVFLSYFVSVRGLWASIKSGPGEHWGAFAMVAALTLVLWFCFGWFREQFCLILCPYGRLQSALTDDDTLVIGYDERRGEPRGAKGRSEGDCVDCRRCVSVCPTGIDIRDGLQMECIGCSACVDACDDIMLKVGRAPGLVRYDSLNGFAGKKRRLYRPRTLLYLGLGLLGLIALSLTAWQQATPFTVEVSRMSGPPFYAEAGTIRNHYRMRFINKRNQPATFRLLLEKAPPGYALSGADIDIQVPPLGEVARPVILLAPADAYHGPCEVTIGTITDPGRVHSQHAVRFLGP